MAGTEEKKAPKKRDPDEAPAIVLIDAVMGALEAGVAYSEILSSLKFARAARGYKAPIWRAAADAINTAAVEAKARSGGGAQDDLELRGPRG